MWLLNALTYKLEYFIGEIPPYAILSHTWETEEVSFQDIRDRPAEAAKLYGYRKIRYTCQEACKRALSYAWVDTCCIDKASSAELSESINSMYGFYQRAKFCFVYLSDVNGDGQTLYDKKEGMVIGCAEYQAYHELLHAFGGSRWFTRGWCLQELIAPRSTRFFDEQFNLIGSKDSLVETLSRITRVDVLVLLDPTKLGIFCIARKMYWASSRVTTRAEDRAYSLMGIFDVNMPLLYGEGGAKAFYRLQQEIIKTSTDQSIFAWNALSMVDERTKLGYLLASSPKCFQYAATITSWSTSPVIQSFTLDNDGLRIQTPLISTANHLCAVLNCRYEDNLVGPICLILSERKPRTKHDTRPQTTVQSRSVGVAVSVDPLRGTRLDVRGLDDALQAPLVDLVIGSPAHSTISSNIPDFATPILTSSFQLYLDEFTQRHFEVVDTWPMNRWNSETLVMRGPLSHQKYRWGCLTFGGKAKPTDMFCLIFAYAPRNEMDGELAFCVHDDSLLTRLSGHIPSEFVLGGSTACIDFEHHNQIFRFQAQMFKEKTIMGSAVRDIRISLVGPRLRNARQPALTLDTIFSNARSV